MPTLDPELLKLLKQWLAPELEGDKIKAGILWRFTRKAKKGPGADIWILTHRWAEIIGERAGVTIEDIAVLQADTSVGQVALKVKANLVNVDNGTTAFVVTTGECSEYNSKSTYPWAIAEKRGVDRAIMKLVGLSGKVYSEIDADDFEEARPKGFEEAEDASEEKSPFHAGDEPSMPTIATEHPTETEVGLSNRGVNEPSRRSKLETARAAIEAKAGAVSTIPEKDSALKLIVEWSGRSTTEGRPYLSDVRRCFAIAWRGADESMGPVPEDPRKATTDQWELLESGLQGLKGIAWDDPSLDD